MMSSTQDSGRGIEVYVVSPSKDGDFSMGAALRRGRSERFQSPGWGSAVFEVEWDESLFPAAVRAEVRLTLFLLLVMNVKR